MVFSFQSSQPFSTSQSHPTMPQVWQPVAPALQWWFNHVAISVPSMASTAAPWCSQAPMGDPWINLLINFGWGKPRGTSGTFFFGVSFCVCFTFFLEHQQKFASSMAYHTPIYHVLTTAHIWTNVVTELVKREHIWLNPFLSYAKQWFPVNVPGHKMGK